jgi:hypothetical protein
MTFQIFGTIWFGQKPEQENHLTVVVKSEKLTEQ